MDKLITIKQLGHFCHTVSSVWPLPQAQSKWPVTQAKSSWPDRFDDLGDHYPKLWNQIISDNHSSIQKPSSIRELPANQNTG